jgi:ferritin-like protein
MFRHTTIALSLLAVMAASLICASPVLKRDYYDSDAIIRGEARGNYVDNIREMCKRTKGQIRTTKEIAACHLYDSIADTGHVLNVDAFIL